jgi:enoyl-CoA hydratase
MKYNTFQYELEDNIGIIRFNRPEAKNALNRELFAELGEILNLVSSDDDVVIVIITGNQEGFAVGADIKEINKIRTTTEAYEFSKMVQSVFLQIEKIEKPVIAAVSGWALGGGFELALACDIRIAGENAQFGQPEIKIGVIPGGGGTQRLPRLIGLGRAKQLLFTGELIDAREAYRIGLVNKVVPPEYVLNEAKRVALNLKILPQLTLRMMKSVINGGIKMDLKSSLLYESRCFALLFSTEDQKEGIKAFLEKRNPIFKNQ